MDTVLPNISLSKRSVAGYIFLPRIIPRVREFFAGGFAMITLFIAIVYNMVRLLPNNHPYLLAENKGQYKLRHVIAAAADNLVFKRENFDQIIVFFAVLTGVVLLFLQFFILLYSFLLQPAAAQIFNTPNPEQDVAFLLLDRVFGVPGLFCNATGDCSALQAELPFAFHIALQSLFQFYSLGMLIVGIIIFLYYAVVVVGETAISGTPFGQRFQNMWVPIRLVVALGLLVPVNFGLNSAQYITLTAAKWGSGLATNGWNQFNAAINDSPAFGGSGGNPIGETESLIAKPQTPDMTPIVHFMALAHACTFDYWVQGNQTLGRPPSNQFYIKPYFAKAPSALNADPALFMEADGMDYDTALDFYNQGDIVIIFGEKYPATKETGYKGNVVPRCGKIRIQTSDTENKGAPERFGGPNAIQKFYYDAIMQMWNDGEIYGMAQRFVAVQNAQRINPCLFTVSTTLVGGADECREPPSVIAKARLSARYNGLADQAVTKAWQDYNTASNDINFEYQDELRNRGWGGAGIWYNKIAQFNGAFVGSTFKMPTIGATDMPMVMQEIRELNGQQNTTPTEEDMYCLKLSGRETQNVPTKDAVTIGRDLCLYQKFWLEDGTNANENEDNLGENFYIDTMHMIFGTAGLFQMRGQNIDVHPLAQLSAVGKGLIDSAVYNIAGSTAFSFGGGIAKALGANGTASGLMIASKAASTVAFVGLTAGFLLYYILPFMPFLYFFFAVATWLKTVFEAMVGVPLWALAHLRLDGEGLPGEGASNGYFMILEIFLRPIIIVFGLIAAMVIFTAQARAMTYIWDLVIMNLTGHEDSSVILVPGASSASVDRGIIDEFFYTIIFTIIMYMMANASFKLIDRIPQGITRWLGASVPAFGDFAADKSLASVNQYVGIAGQTMIPQVTGQLNQTASGLGGALFRGAGGGGPAPPPKP